MDAQTRKRECVLEWIDLDGKTCRHAKRSLSKENPETDITYDPTGSGAGIQAVQEDRCDIGLSSRYLKEEEKEAGLKETIVALDGIAVIVNPENPISDLSLEQVADIFTGKITNWKELGGNDQEIVLIGREAGSGTRDGFETITKTEENCQYRQELTSTGDVITTVSSNPSAIGYASLEALGDSVKRFQSMGCHVMFNRYRIKNMRL